MQDKSINGALLALRKQIIRENLDGLEHVEALLRLRSVPMPRVMIPKRSDAAKRGLMRLLILEALRDGPKTIRGLADYVDARRPEISHRACYKRCSQCLVKLRKDGLVANEGGVWRLRQKAAEGRINLLSTDSCLEM